MGFSIEAMTGMRAELMKLAEQHPNPLPKHGKHRQRKRGPAASASATANSHIPAWATPKQRSGRSSSVASSKPARCIPTSVRGASAFTPAGCSPMRTKAEAVFDYWETDFDDCAHLRYGWNNRFVCHNAVGNFHCTRTTHYSGRHVAHDGLGRVLSHWTSAADYIAVIPAAALPSGMTHFGEQDSENTSQS